MDTIIGIFIIALLLGSQLFGGIVSGGETVTSESPINIHSDSVDSTPDYTTLSTSTVTCYFHAGGECNPSGYPNSCTPSCSGTLSGCGCEIDNEHYYCYEEGYCFSEAGCDSGGCDCDTHRGDLQVNVDNINGYPVANVYVYVDGEERALTNPFGYAYIEDVPYGNHHIDIRYRITNLDYEGDYQKSRDITVDESKEVVNFIATLPGESRVAQSKGDCSNFSRIDDFTPEIAPVAVAMAVIDVASVAWSTEEFCKCVFQEEDSFGVPQCVNAIKGCVGDTRNCVAEIRENAGPAADRCKFEEAMLVGDAVSPFIPAGFVGHGLAMVVGKGRALKFVDDIGETGRVIKTKANGTVEYVKGGVSWTVKWFDDVGFKLGIIHYVPWWDELSQPALNGWNKALKNVDKQTGKGLLESLGKGKADRAGKNLAEMSDDTAEWMAKSEIGRKALKEWGDDAQKGLAKIFKKHGEGFVNTLVKQYKEEIVEITSKGVEWNVIDMNKVNPEKLAVYVRGTGIDPIDITAGEEQLVRMLKAPSRSVKAGTEVVSDTTVIKVGKEDYFVDGVWKPGFGKKHIQFKHIDGSPERGTSLFPEGMDWDEVEEMIEAGLEKGTPDPQDVTKIIFRPIDHGFNNGVDEMGIIEKGRGVTTAFPKEGLGVRWPWGK